MFDARPTCSRCRRPASVCYCPFLTSIPTRTRIVLLQHPREREVAIGTARLASLCLPNAELHIGIDWTHSPAVRRALSDPARPAVLLYPGEEAVDVAALSTLPLTLVVIDGTWPQTRKMVRQNPQLAALPRLSFSPLAPSEYRIRREPRADFVSTLEALVHVLGHLEGDPQRFQALMDPFRAMIDMQIDHETRLRRPWSRQKRPVRLEATDPPGPPDSRDLYERPEGLEPRVRAGLPQILKARGGDLLCVTVEANAWPRRAGPTGLPVPAGSTGGSPDQLVYLLAQRLRTGERLEAFIAPRGPLNPATPAHTGLSLEQLLAGLELDAVRARWRAFIRDTDLLCAWGDYAFTLLEKEGLSLPAGRLDLRRTMGDLLRERPGTMARWLERLGIASHPAWGEGRGGERHGQLTALAGELARESASA